LFGWQLRKVSGDIDPTKNEFKMSKWKPTQNELSQSGLQKIWIEEEKMVPCLRWKLKIFRKKVYYSKTLLYESQQLVLQTTVSNTIFIEAFQNCVHNC
jgi:hypothetical protein